jgi:ribosome-binding protein aMBF1 (putative translation factor)
MKLTELKTADQVLDERRQDPEFAGEWDRTAFARDVATRVAQYRAEHDLTQTELARRLGMTQSVIARLESGDQPPPIATLVKLTRSTGLEFDLRFARGAVQFIS